VDHLGLKSTVPGSVAIDKHPNQLGRERWAWHEERDLQKQFIRTSKGGEVDLCEHNGSTTIVKRLGCFLNETDTHKRIYSAFGYLAPIEFDVLWRCNHGLPPDVYQNQSQVSKCMMPLQFGL
jgi:hypothetical protein